MAGNTGNTQLRELAMVFAPAVLVCVGALWLAFQFVEPAPPKVVQMSTGGEAGAYYRFGKQYAELMKAQGVHIEVAPSAGAAENAKRLDDPASGFKIALLQGGIASADTSPDLVSLGRVFLEPLWIFYRGATTRTRLAELRGLRLAVGGEGGGTRVLAETLLKANNVTTANTTLLPLAGQKAVDALLGDQADAIFLAFAPQAPIIQELLRNPNVRLMSLAQAEAYTRIFPYLSKVVLPQGVIDLDANVPAADVTLVAAQAALVARKDLHPALAELMVDVVQSVHGKGGLFQRIGDFPKGQDPEFPMSDDAERIYKNGQPFLRRFLPFWLAKFIERTIVLVLPLATIFIPVAKLLPWLYEWRIKQRLLYWYGQLKTLEKRIGPGRGELATGQRRSECLTEIDRIDHAVSLIPVPLRYSDRLYELRAAIDLVRNRLGSAA